jgi:hypothetical protein
MTRFEDQLFSQLMEDHGDQLRSTQRQAPARRRVPRPAWLAAGATGAAAAATVTALALCSAPALAAYSVTRHGQTVTVSVQRTSGVAGANAALRHMHVRVRVVPVRPGCTPIGSLPRPQPAPHPAITVGTRENAHGHRSVSVTVKGPIPAGDTLLLAFSGGHGPGSTSLGAGGFITGRPPRCVSLPES